MVTTEGAHTAYGGENLYSKNLHLPNCHGQDQNKRKKNAIFPLSVGPNYHCDILNFIADLWLRLKT